jgi:hypothetical protein
VSRGWRVGLALVAIGCSNLPSGEGGVVALELRLPSPAAVELNDTLRLRARALNADGDSVADTVYWRTLDDTVLTIVDSIGLVTTSKTSGQARVQAHVGGLRSDIVILTIRPPSDTLLLTVGDTITVPAGDPASGTLGAAVQSTSPAAGVAGTSILFEVIDAVAAQGKVEFSNKGLLLRATTGTDGAPVTPVTLRKVAGQAPPATVQVRVSATRPSGVAVPGSGQAFTLLFQ